MNKSIVVIQATFHKEVTDVMLKAAEKEASNCGLDFSKVVSVPGSMEMPLALSRNLIQDDFAGAVLLGIIERGETKHGMVMAQAVIGSVIDTQIRLNKPVGVGILGPEIYPSQIPPRLEGYAKAAVKSVHHMLGLK